MDTLFDLDACEAAPLAALPGDPDEIAALRVKHTNPALFRRDCAERARIQFTHARSTFAQWRKLSDRARDALYGAGRFSTYERNSERARDLRKSIAEADRLGCIFARFAEDELPEGDSLESAAKEREAAMSR